MKLYNCTISEKGHEDFRPIESRFKYVVEIHRKAFGDWECIGVLGAQTIEKAKKAARDHARRWNKHGNRLYLTCRNTGREWVINS